MDLKCKVNLARQTLCRHISPGDGLGVGLGQFSPGPQQIPLQSTSESTVVPVRPPAQIPHESTSAVPKQSPLQSRNRPPPPHTPEGEHKRIGNTAESNSWGRHHATRVDTLLETEAGGRGNNGFVR